VGLAAMIREIDYVDHFENPKAWNGKVANDL